MEVDKWLIFRWLQFIFPVIRRLTLPRTFNYTHNHYVFSKHIFTFCKQWKSRLNFCRLCETLAMNLSFMGIIWYTVTSWTFLRCHILHCALHVFRNIPSYSVNFILILYLKKVRFRDTVLSKATLVIVGKREEDLILGGRCRSKFWHQN